MFYGVCTDCYTKTEVIKKVYDELPGICMKGIEGGIELFEITTYKCPNCGKGFEIMKLISSSPEKSFPTLEQVEIEETIDITGVPCCVFGE